MQNAEYPVIIILITILLVISPITDITNYNNNVCSYGLIDRNRSLAKVIKNDAKYLQKK